MAAEQSIAVETGAGSRRGWAGDSGETTSAPQRQWQGGAAPGIDRHFRSSRRRWKLRIGALLVLALLLTVGYLVLLLHFPQRTPLVVAAATDYAWPVAPNAWAREDVDGLRRLDGQIVELLDSSLAWKSRQHILSEWDRSLAKVARQRSATNSAVFYLSLHGLVSEDGVPCLLPPGASPLEREQWVSVEELLLRMKESLPATLHKLLILDCNRQLDNWSAGLVHNTFAERVAERVAELKLPNLVVLNSTAPGERAWSSPDLRGSIFGRAVLLGLAGAADRTTETSGAAGGTPPPQSADALRGGDGDGRVTAKELRRYVAREVGRWLREQCQATQTPQLLPEDAVDFTVTWTLHPGALRKIEQELAANSRAPDSVTAEDIDALWTSFDALRELRLERVDPILWHDLEHELLWLEQLATSGVGYATVARQRHELLRGRLEKAVQRAAIVQARPTLAGQLSVLGEDRVPWPRTLALASLTLNEQLGILDATQASAVEAALRTSAAGDADPVPEGDDVPAERLERLSELQFQRLARRYQAGTLWSDANLLRDFTDSRLRLENLAARLDPRGHQRLRSAWSGADRERRKAEDHVLAGEGTVDGDPVAILQAAYEQLAGRADAPATAWDRAWAVRDRALSEIPYWARWMASSWRQTDARIADAAPPASSVNPSEEAAAARSTPSSDPVLERLPKLVVTAHQLNHLLDESPTDGADTLPEVIGLANLLEAELDQLKIEFLGLCASLDRDPFPSAGGRQRIEEALQTPLIPAAQRLALRRTLARFSSELHERAGERGRPTTSENVAAGVNAATTSVEGAGQPDGESWSGTAEGQRLANWRIHPLMTILWSSEELAALQKEIAQGPAAGPREFAAQLERTSQRLRTRLLEIDAASRGQVTASVAGVATGSKPDPERRVKVTERNARLAAAVWLPPAQDDAIQTRRRHDLQRLLLWYAERTLDDCYGAGPRDPLVPIPRPPFFDRSVQDYLLAAALLAPLDAHATAETERIRTRLAARVRAMKSWGTIRVLRDGVATMGEEVGYQARLTAPNHAAESSSSSALPEGLATVFLRGGDRRPLGRRAVVALPWANRETHVALAAPAAASDVGLEAVLLFRGHEIPEAVDDQQPAGIVVDLRPEHPRQAQVTVFGDRRQRSSVVFILDCSGSMGTEIAVEAAGPATLPRLDLAKSSLTSLLEQLAPRGDARVGVRFFGHRVGFSKEKPVKVLRLDGYPDPIPDDLHPSDDVELFLPLGRFDSVEAGRVTQRLQVLKPWGQSPLYRALLQAKADFDTESDDTNMSVVVITDGENYQYAGTDPTLRAPQSATVQEVQSAYRGRRIPIYILGFGLSSATDQNAEREFTQLADSTQGRYFAVQNGRDLLKTLRTRLGVGTYALQDGQGRPVAISGSSESTTRLNLPITVSDLGAGPRPYSVRFESASASLRLEGGEAIALQSTPDGRDLMALPYDQGLPVSDVLSLNGRKERFTVRAHRPLRESKHVRFRVSLQDEDLRFTERPAETWIEIKPVLSEEGIDPPTYVFYDREFVAGEPVPVLDCVANSWPAAAKLAEVRVWCKLAATPPAQEMTLAALLQDVERFEELQTVSGVEEIQYRATVPEAPGTEGAWELRVVTQLAADGGDIANLRVSWQSDPNVHPQRIVHRYEPSRRQAVHSFWFPASVPPRAVAQAGGRVTFTSRAATRNGAFRAANDRPLIVDVTGGDQTLPLDAATGVR